MVKIMVPNPSFLMQDDLGGFTPIFKRCFNLVEIEEVDLFDPRCFCMDELRRTDAVW